MAAQSEAICTNMGLCSALNAAHAAAHLLAEQGIEVFAACTTVPHLPTLFVSSLPVGAEFGLKTRYPNSRGGVTMIHVAVWQGVRLEWMHDHSGMQEVGHD